MVKNQIHFTSHTVQRDLANVHAALGKLCPQKLCAGEGSAWAHKSYWWGCSQAVLIVQFQHQFQ